MSKKSKKNHNDNHNQNTPEPVRIQPEHQPQTESNPKPARRWFPRIRTYVANCAAALKNEVKKAYQQQMAIVQMAKVEIIASAARIAAPAKLRIAYGRQLAQVDPRSPSLRLTGAALIVAAVWGPLGLLAFITGIVLLVRPAVVPRLVYAGLAWAMASAEEADSLLARAWMAVTTKVRAWMAAPVLEAELAS